MQQAIVVDPQKMVQAARRLSHEGIWVRRDFWTDENGLEVDEHDPKACNREHVYEVDYDRIVSLVVQHLAGTPPDWLTDPLLSREERLARFEALSPELTRAPQGTT